MARAKTKTGKVAGLLMAEGRGTLMFNDRLVDGRRSLKVWGWNQVDYLKAKTMLEQEGCTVDIVKTQYFQSGNRRYKNTRLHVTE